jgi:cation:H+ antiporter
MDLLWLVVGFTLLAVGAEALVRGAVNLALRAHVSPLVVGLTIVALGTSAPELVVSLHSALQGRGDVSVGNVVGSNICNVGLILGLAALLRPLSVRVQLVRSELPVLLVVSLLLVIFLRNEAISRIEGLILVAGSALYFWTQITLARRSPLPGIDLTSLPAASRPPRRRLIVDLLLIGGGIAILVVGAGRFLTGAVGIARTVGVSEAVIGLTLVAVGTSLPELATSVVAALRSQGDVAIGNVIGSNILNVLVILGLTGSVAPLHSPGIATVDLAAMCGFAILLLPLLRSGFTLSRPEGGVLLALYAAYLLQFRR